MRPTAWIRARLGRGWSLSSLGANEARILFDVAASAAAVGAALGFLALFVPGSTSFRRTVPLVMAPILFIAWNVVAGLYTRLRIAGPLALDWMEIAQAFAGPPGEGRRPGQFPIT